MLKKSITKCLTVVLAGVVCVSIPYAGYAAIGAEPSNKAADAPTYSAAPAVANIPPYPVTGSQPGMQAYQDIPAYLYQQGTAPNYGSMPGMAPYSSAMPYGDMSGGGTYMPMPPMSGYGDMSGGGGYMPMPPTAGYGDMSGGGGYMPMPPMGNMPGMPYPGPQMGEQIPQNPMPYTMHPYDPYQPYPGSGQGSWYPQNPGYPPYNYGTADQTYKEARQAYVGKDYWTAMTKFQEVAMRFPQSDLVDNAYYWMGEIQLAWKNYPAAIQSFQTVLYSYPTGNKVPDAHVKMGLAYADIRQYAMAKNILNEVLARYPDNARIRAIALKKLNELNNLY